MTTTSPVLPYRRALSALLLAVYVLLPFLKVNGESALRFDIPDLILYFFGTNLWIDEFIVLLAVLLFLTFLFIWVTLIFGRVWCEWLCPQSLLVEVSTLLFHSRALVYMFTLLVSVLVGAASLWYFVPPLEFIDRLISLELGRVEGWTWGVLTVFLWLDTIVFGRIFCSTVCPYAKIQSVMFDSNTMAIAYDASRDDECMDCEACIKVCPVGIDLREGPNSRCFSCSMCRDACAERLAKKERQGLILHFFGSSGEPPRLLRAVSLWLGLLVVATFLFLVLVSLNRKDMDIVVLPNHDFTTKITRDGGMITFYYLSLSNRSDEEIALELSTVGALVLPEVITIGPGEHRRMQIVFYLTHINKSVELNINRTGGAQALSFELKIRFPEGLDGGRN
jgi:polyferredoxin